MSGCCGGFIAPSGPSGGGGGGASGVFIDDDGTPVSASRFDTLDFIGPGVIAVDAGGGVVAITIPGGIAGVSWAEEGGLIVLSASANFVGPGATVTDVAGVATITIPGGITLQNDFAPFGYFTTLNIYGSGRRLINEGAGVAGVNIPGVFFTKDGVPVGGAPHFIANFTGGGVTLTNSNPDEVSIAIPGNTSYLGQWFKNAVTAAFGGPMDAQFSQNFDDWKAIRAGSIAGLITRFSEDITAGSMTVRVTINGVATAATLTHTAVLNTDGGIITNTPGDIPYAAGDLIGVELITNLAFLPLTLNAEASVNIFETP